MPSSMNVKAYYCRKDVLNSKAKQRKDDENDGFVMIENDDLPETSTSRSNEQSNTLKPRNIFGLPAEHDCEIHVQGERFAVQANFIMVKSKLFKNAFYELIVENGIKYNKMIVVEITGVSHNFVRLILSSYYKNFPKNSVEISRISNFFYGLKPEYGVFNNREFLTLLKLIRFHSNFNRTELSRSPVKKFTMTDGDKEIQQAFEEFKEFCKQMEIPPKRSMRVFVDKLFELNRPMTKMDFEKLKQKLIDNENELEIIEIIDAELESLKQCDGKFSKQHTLSEETNKTIFQITIALIMTLFFMFFFFVLKFGVDLISYITGLL